MLRIGVALKTNPLGLALLRGVSRFASQRRDWIVKGTRSSVPLIDWKHLADWSGDGLIVAASDRETCATLSSRPFPVVNVSHRLTPDSLNTVGPDDVAVGRLATQHLLDRGHVQLAYVGYANHYYSEQRREGFLATCVAAGREPLVLVVDRDHALDQVVGQLPPRCGVLACNDDLARDLVEACDLAGRRVPEEVAVIGVDNTELHGLLAHVPLSTIDIDPDAIGFRAAALLQDLIDGKVANPPVHLRIPPKEVLVRRSSDTFAVSDELVRRAAVLIDRGLVRGITAEELAEKLGVSQRTLETRVRAALSTTPLSLITSMRIDRAKGLLRSTEHSIKQIAAECGFPSPERMSIVFRRETGQTPTLYRQWFRVPG